MRWWMILGVLVLACDENGDSGQAAGGGGTGGRSGAGAGGTAAAHAGQAGDAGGATAGLGGEAADGGSAGVSSECPLMAPSEGSSCFDSFVRCHYDPVTRCLCATLDMDSACVGLDPRCGESPGEGGGAGGPSFQRAYQCDCVTLDCDCGTPPGWACMGLE